MFGLSFGEILIVLVVALLVLGPERLPKVARSIGKGLRDLRRTTGSLREIIEDEIYLDEVAERRPAGRPEGEPVPRAHAAPAAQGTGPLASPASAAGAEGEPVPRAPATLSAEGEARATVSPKDGGQAGGPIAAAAETGGRGEP